jgi:hypothetical protein
MNNYLLKLIHCPHFLKLTFEMVHHQGAKLDYLEACGYLGLYKLLTQGFYNPNQHWDVRYVQIGISMILGCDVHCIVTKTGRILHHNRLIPLEQFAYRNALTEFLL